MSKFKFCLKTAIVLGKWLAVFTAVYYGLLAEERCSNSPTSYTRWAGRENIEIINVGSMDSFDTMASTTTAMPLVTAAMMLPATSANAEPAAAAAIFDNGHFKGALLPLNGRVVGRRKIGKWAK